VPCTKSRAGVRKFSTCSLGISLPTCIRPAYGYGNLLYEPFCPPHQAHQVVIKSRWHDALRAEPVCALLDQMFWVCHFLQHTNGVPTRDVLLKGW
jgi:hypothetical protein